MAANMIRIVRDAQSLVQGAIADGHIKGKLATQLLSEVVHAEMPTGFRYPTLALSYRGAVHWEDHNDPPENWARWVDPEPEAPLEVFDDGDDRPMEDKLAEHGTEKSDDEPGTDGEEGPAERASHAPPATSRNRKRKSGG